ncbi:hypothetical protein EZS27_024845, partial [termite gut metagenome]
MNYQEVLTLARSLSTEEQLQLIVSLSPSSQDDTGALRSRCAALINKQATCPYCGGKHYRRYGKAHGSQRFMCN